MSELARIAALKRILEADGGQVVVGIGDDAAAVAFEGTLISSVDAMVEHVHFERAWLSLEELGFKATMSALSDLAAMGATPRGVLGSWVLPRDITDRNVEAIAKGVATACRESGTSVIGGNLSAGGELAIHTTVLGHAARPLRREGACEGDLVLMAGEVGLAAAALYRLHEEAEVPPLWSAAWRRPRARIAEGARAAAFATAAIDISDGLAADVAHISKASTVAIVLDAQALVIEALAPMGPKALPLALHGGEDYALVVTSPQPIEGFRQIGVVEPGIGVFLDDKGRREQLIGSGWDHFPG